MEASGVVTQPPAKTSAGNLDLSSEQVPTASAVAAEPSPSGVEPPNSSMQPPPAAALGPEQHAQNKPFDPIEGTVVILARTTLKAAETSHACKHSHHLEGSSQLSPLVSVVDICSLEGWWLETGQRNSGQARRISRSAAGAAGRCCPTGWRCGGTYQGNSSRVSCGCLDQAAGHGHHSVPYKPAARAPAGRSPPLRLDATPPPFKATASACLSQCANEKHRLLQLGLS